MNRPKIGFDLKTKLILYVAVIITSIALAIDSISFLQFVNTLITFFSFFVGKSLEQEHYKEKYQILEEREKELVKRETLFKKKLPKQWQKVVDSEDKSN